QAAVKSQPITYEKGVLSFASLTFYGPARTATINGQTVNLAPRRGYDSPFIRSDWNSGLIHIRKGSDTLILDFRDPQKPVKAMSVPITAAFPPGIGPQQP